MFRILLSCSLFIAIASSVALAAPEIATKQAEFDFGSVDNRQIIKHTFVLTNAGDEDLTISQVKPACGCTVTELSKKVLPPGESVDLNVQVTLKGMKGHQLKQITVESNDPQKPKLVLALRGEATSPITITPARLLFGEVVPGAAAPVLVANADDNDTSSKKDIITREVVITFDEQLTLHVTKTEVIPSSSVAQPPNDSTWTAAIKNQNDDAQGIIRVEVALLPGVSLGQTKATVRLLTDSDEFPYIDIPVSAVVAGEINYSPQSIVLLERNAEPVTRYLLITKGNHLKDTDFQITKITPPLPEIKVEIRPIGKRGYRIKLTDLLPTPDMANTKLVIETNIASMKRIEIPVRVIADESQAAKK